MNTTNKAVKLINIRTQCCRCGHTSNDLLPCPNCDAAQSEPELETLLSKYELNGNTMEFPAPDKVRRVAREFAQMQIQKYIIKNSK